MICDQADVDIGTEVASGVDIWFVGVIISMEKRSSKTVIIAPLFKDLISPIVIIIWEGLFLSTVATTEQN